MFGWLRKKKTKTYQAKYIACDKTFSYEIVGESFYQKDLARIAGPKEPQSKSHYCKALLICEANNPRDPNAVAVMIDDSIVGYLSREDAIDYRGFLEEGFSEHPLVVVDALICGGWLDEKSEGHYGVKLDLETNWDD